MRRLFITFLLFKTICSNAYDAKINGIFYNLDEEKNEATVTYESDPWSGGNSLSYQGDIVIPDYVTYNNKNYKVVCIGEKAFMYTEKLTSVELSSSVVSIKESAFSYSSVREILIGENVKEVLDAFKQTKRLRSISFPNSVEIFEACFIHGAISRISLGKGITSIPRYFVSFCPLSDLFCYSKQPPKTNEDSFAEVYSLGRATLHVPKETIEVYKTTSPWSRFENIVPISDEMPAEASDRVCRNPKIFYKDGVVTFESETPNAEFVTNITDEDIKYHYGESIKLGLTYTIKVYAFAEGYQNSDEVTATLCWIDKEPKTEGISNSVANVNARAVLIQSNGGNITIQGCDDGEQVSVYSINGEQLGYAISKNGQASVDTSIKQGSVAIVKMGNKSVKISIR